MKPTQKNALLLRHASTCLFLNSDRQHDADEYQTEYHVQNDEVVDDKADDNDQTTDVAGLRFGFSGRRRGGVDSRRSSTAGSDAAADGYGRANILVIQAFLILVVDTRTSVPFRIQLCTHLSALKPIEARRVLLQVFYITRESREGEWSIYILLYI